MKPTGATKEATGHSPLPWKITGATIIWSPTGHSNVAAVSDPRPPNNSSVGYYEMRPWDASDGADERFREACANAELIVTAVNERERLREALALAVIPYEAILMDGESRRWIAPAVWEAMENAVVSARAVLNDATPSTNAGSG